MPDPTRNLAFVLADEGYDVWLVNNRGNKYSGIHTKYNWWDKKYWDYSIDELVKYDVPAVVDLVLAETGWEKVAVWGVYAY